MILVEVLCRLGQIGRVVGVVIALFLLYFASWTSRQLLSSLVLESIRSIEDYSPT